MCPVAVAEGVGLRMLASNSWVWLRGGAQNVGLQLMGVAEGWGSDCWLATQGRHPQKI